MPVTPEALAERGPQKFFWGVDRTSEGLAVAEPLAALMIMRGWNNVRLAVKTRGKADNSPLDPRAAEQLIAWRTTTSRFYERQRDHELTDVEALVRKHHRQPDHDKDTSTKRALFRLGEIAAVRRSWAELAVTCYVARDDHQLLIPREGIEVTVEGLETRAANVRTKDIRGSELQQLFYTEALLYDLEAQGIPVSQHA